MSDHHIAIDNPGMECWSCGEYFTCEQLSECDGHCPHCDSPIDLEGEDR